MNKREKELLIEDLCARLPYGVKVQHRGGYHQLIEMDCCGNFKVDGYDAYFNLDTTPLKPYLRDLADMTPGEQIEHDDFIEHAYIDYSSTTLTCVETCRVSDYIKWLNSHQFDWRDLIPQGLAIKIK